MEFQAIQGVSGYSGIGQSGYSGYSGVGTSGYSGYSGIEGASGYSGISGYSGEQGISGYSGIGTSGYSGISGRSGYSGTLPAGTVIAITGMWTEVSGTRAAGGSTNMRTYALAANSYSFVRVRATGSIQGPTNAQGIGTITITGVGSTSPAISVRMDATGTNDVFIYPWAIEYAAAQTGAATINVVVTSTAGTLTYKCESTVVEGII